jgi:hypothetical protein
VSEAPPRASLSAQTVEETYLSLQSAHRTLRRARNGDEDAPSVEEAAVELQDVVLTFFEFLRPYIKDAPGLREYWEGALVDYPPERRRFDSQKELLAYYRDNSVGVWQSQVHHPDTIPHPSSTAAAATETANTALADGGEVPETLRGWHDALRLTSRERIVAITKAPDDDPIDGWYYRPARFSVLGLRDLEDWGVAERTVRERGVGFMAGEVAEKTAREPEDPGKVETAKRMLVEVAEELGALPAYDTTDNREAEFDYSDVV